MIKYILSILFLITSFYLKSQSKVITDTIYLHKKFNSYITFGKRIQKINFGSNVFAVSGQGSPDFLNGKSIVTIKASKRFRETTNVTAISEDFTYYNIICLYTEKQPASVFHFYDMPHKKISKKELEKEKEEAKDIFVEDAFKAEEKEALFQEHFFVDTIYYKAQAKKINTDHKAYNKIKRWFEKDNKIILSLMGTFARKDKIYIKIRIDNGASTPFHIDGWNFNYLKNEGWNSSTQPDGKVVPIYEYNTKFQSVLPYRHMYRTFVFENFAIQKGKYLIVQLHQKNSERNIKLKIPAQRINDPIPIQKHWDQKTLDMIKEMELKEKEELRQRKSSKESDNSKEDIKLLPNENNK